LKGQRFATVEEVKTASQETLNNVKLLQFQRSFTQWEKRLDKCIASNGEYFEGDKVFFVRNVNKTFFKEFRFSLGPSTYRQVAKGGLREVVRTYNKVNVNIGSAK